MTIIPSLYCSSMKKSLDFYTNTLDFKRVGGDDGDEPAFCILEREGGHLILSVLPGDGAPGTIVVVSTDDADALFKKFKERGLRTPGNPAAPREVHEGPIDQSWGNREFYVKDPDRNTLRFIQWG